MRISDWSSDVCSSDLAWNGLADRPAYRRLKAPETGLAMIRARAGGVGQRFNFGEMTMTRCVVVLEGTGAQKELMGVGYVQGRDARKAELIDRKSTRLNSSP